MSISPYMFSVFSPPPGSIVIGRICLFVREARCDLSQSTSLIFNEICQQCPASVTNLTVKFVFSGTEAYLAMV